MILHKKFGSLGHSVDRDPCRLQFLLGSQEITNTHIPVVTKTSVTVALMLINQCSFEYLQSYGLHLLQAHCTAVLRPCATVTVWLLFDHTRTCVLSRVILISSKLMTDCSLPLNIQWFIQKTFKLKKKFAICSYLKPHPVSVSTHTVQLIFSSSLCCSP